MCPRRLFLDDREFVGAPTKSFLNGDSQWVGLVPGGQTC